METACQNSPKDLNKLPSYEENNCGTNPHSDHVKDSHHDEESVQKQPTPEASNSVAEIGITIPTEANNTANTAPNGAVDGRRLRFAFFVVTTVTLVLVKSAVLSRDSYTCLRDFVHEKLEYYNTMMLTHASLRAGLQISSSVMMDFSYLALFLYWVLYAKSCRVVVSVLIFYAVRGITQSYFVLGFPAGFTWDDPGFPSLIVPYGPTSDFYYSGHCGFLMICALEWSDLGFKSLSFLTHCMNAYLAFVMLICRCHYSIDIMAGIVMGHYIFMLVTTRASKMDSLMSDISTKLRVCLEGKSKPSSSPNQAVQNDRLIYKPPKTTTTKAYELDF